MKFRPRYIWWCFLFWTTIALLSFAGNYFSAVLKDFQFHWREVVPFATAWYTWFPFTFPVIYMADRFSYSDTSRLKFFLAHAVAFLVINSLQILLSASYIKLMLQSLNGGYYSNILSKTAISGSFYNLLIYVAALVLLNSIKNYRHLQNEKAKTTELEKQLANSRMNFLKQQLQPHFLFNAHHAIITLMKMNEKGKAIAMMEKLSDLMRFAIRENNSQEITLQKELHLLNLYLDIQKIRFEEKLKVEINICDDLMQAYTPSMILQPIVENSIKYAVEKTSAESTISIHAEKRDESLIICVKDQVKELTQEGVLQKGIGLGNTEERLEKLYGRQQQLQIRSYSHGEFKGMQVTIKIPLRYATN